MFIKNIDIAYIIDVYETTSKEGNLVVIFQSSKCVYLLA